MSKRKTSPKNDEAFIPLSVRPGDKISSLLEIIAKSTSKSPATYASDGISEALSRYMASSRPALDVAAAQITKILEEGGELQKGSALALLVERKIIEIRP